MTTTSLVTIEDKSFEITIDHETILNRVKEVALQINQDFKDEKPIFVSVLNGAFMFTSDLVKEIDFPCEISFIKVSSYEGVSSTGKVTTHIGLNQSVKDRTVIIIEDIIETGNTIQQLVGMLQEEGVKDIQLATLLHKPGCLKHPLNIKYIGFEIPDDFIIGYGLDYNGFGRNLKDLYVLSTQD